jgi:hypothetical protein
VQLAVGSESSLHTWLTAPGVKNDSVALVALVMAGGLESSCVLRSEGDDVR